MSMYVIPEELISLKKAMYNNFECAVVEEGETTKWFQVQPAVKQGCTMSGFLFLLSIDWVMNRTREGRRIGQAYDGSLPRPSKILISQTKLPYCHLDMLKIRPVGLSMKLPE